MTIPRTWTALLAIGGLLAFLPALAGADQKHGSASSSSKSQTLEIAVTESGFVLTSGGTVKVGEPVKLIVTRKTDQTCATEILIQDYGIKQALPLNKPVEVTFTPKKAGPIHYTCGMGMAGPAIVAQ